MKQYSFVSILLTCLLSACNTKAPVFVPTATSVPLPVIVVDKQHMTTAGLAYQIPAGPGFVLDASNYAFGSSTPMAVQVVTNNNSYQAPWTKNATSQAVLVSDLKPVFNATPLKTFFSGRQLIVSIGSLTPQGHFKPLWVAVIDVK